MENTLKPGIRIKKSTLNKTLAALSLIIIAAFAYFYIVNQNPFTNVKVPIGPPGPPAFSHFIYGGFGDEQLWKPMAVTTIGDRVFISDTNNYRIRVFTKDGIALNTFSKRGYGKGEVQFPYGLTSDDKGRLLVADMYTGKISVFDIEGKFIEYFGQKNDISKVLKSPSDITFVDGKLYVADVTKNRVFVFDNTGKLLQELGKEFGELYSPNGLAVDAKTGEVTVIDTGNNRAVIYDKAGKLLGQFDGTKGNSDSALWSNPRGVAVDSRGVLYVVSQLSHYIYGYDDEYEQLFVFGGMGDTQDKFVLPNGIHIDENDYVYITDTTNNRIAVFR